MDTYFGASTTKHMAIFIDRCAAGSVAGKACASDQSDSDSNYYTWYAGPADVTGTANHCTKLHC
ncbi:hypothetical protein [Streptomyces cyaneus]|uniref:hypothetical protein n=1 Tax=Streptomyces cyaneus TaxID=1904 RepID=UPI000FF8ADA3|nr:hypothetical protein [Streptomyces cyaneus]